MPNGSAEKRDAIDLFVRLQTAVAVLTECADVARECGQTEQWMPVQITTRTHYCLGVAEGLLDSVKRHLMQTSRAPAAATPYVKASKHRFEDIAELKFRR